MPIYRGETFIENVERLPDGSSHLLLRIEDDSELIDSKNLNKAKGKYKYRFKRIGLLNNEPTIATHSKLAQPTSTQEQVVAIQKKTVVDQAAGTDSTTESESDLSERSKEIVQMALGNAIEKIKLAKDSRKTRVPTPKSSSPEPMSSSSSVSSSVSPKKESDDANKLPSFNEKRKLFENSSANPPKAVQASSAVEPTASSSKSQESSMPKSNKVLDLIKQLNQQTQLDVTTKPAWVR